jgi:hypothetical protein
LSLRESVSGDSVIKIDRSSGGERIAHVGNKRKRLAVEDRKSLLEGSGRVINPRDDDTLCKMGDRVLISSSDIEIVVSRSL